MEAGSVQEPLAPHALAPRIASELGLSSEATEAALRLLAEGAHPPFVARYRKERTRGLAIEVLEAIQARAGREAQFELRRSSLVRELEQRGLLSEQVSRWLTDASDDAALEDIKLLLRKRKRGAASKARAHGLGPVAQRIWDHGSRGSLAAQHPEDVTITPRQLAEDNTSEAFPTVDEVMAGVTAVCIEMAAMHPPLRKALRELVHGEGTLQTKVLDKKGKAAKYKALDDRKIAVSSVSGPDILAISRGEREKVVAVAIEQPEERVVEIAREVLAIDAESPCGSYLEQCIRDGWHGALGKAIHTGVRKQLKRNGDAQAIHRYSEMLRPLLLAPPFGRQPVLAIDPGFQPGCRLVVLDRGGVPVAEDTVFPLQPKLQAPQAKARIAELCKEHGIEAIAVGNGSGGREVERLCRELTRDEAAGVGQVVVAAVDADAAALYASSRTGKEAFPKSDNAYRRAVSLGRRLQDPLLELTRIDLRKLGLGQYQHEVDQDELRYALGQVLSSCINWVGVRVNEVSAEHLVYVGGMSQALAKAVLNHRNEHGLFRTRAQLLDVPGVPGKAFEQASGFLRIEGGEQPLDATTIHPERYSQVLEMCRDQGHTLQDVLGNDEAVDQIAEQKQRYLGKPGISGEPLGEPTLQDILAELRAPGKDIRPEFTPVNYHPDLDSFTDVHVGMELEGVVTHLAPFGVFVDVGIAEEGLVHVSELTHKYVSTPFEAVHVGQRVKGRVLEVDTDRKRFSLSLKALLPKPAQPGDKRKRKPRPKKAKGKGRGSRKPQDKRKSEKTLGFRLDLSEIAKRLENEG